MGALELVLVGVAVGLEGVAVVVVLEVVLAVSTEVDFVVLVEVFPFPLFSLLCLKSWIGSFA